MFNQIIAACVFAFVCVRDVGSQCPNSWTRFQESCYHIIENKETWLEANEYCKLFRGYLAELTTRDEINFAKREYAARHLNENVWIGLSDIVEEGVWMWTSEMTKVQETNWAPGQPDNRSEEDCVAIVPDNLWHDGFCNSVFFYMCEMSDTDPVIG